MWWNAGLPAMAGPYTLPSPPPPGEVRRPGAPHPRGLTSGPPNQIGAPSRSGPSPAAAPAARCGPGRPAPPSAVSSQSIRASNKYHSLCALGERPPEGSAETGSRGEGASATSTARCRPGFRGSRRSPLHTGLASRRSSSCPDHPETNAVETCKESEAPSARPCLR